MVEKLGGFVLGQAPADRFPGDVARGFGVQLVPLGKVLVVCQVSYGGFKAGMNDRCRRLDHNARTPVNAIGEPKQRHETDLMSDVNSGKEWSPMDLADLQNSLAEGYSIEEVAQFLCRDVGEVQAKMAGL
jgi:hypothetical protein